MAIVDFAGEGSGAEKPRFRWSVWRVTGVAASLALLVLALSFYRFDRKAASVTERNNVSIATTAAVQAPAEPAKTEPAKPASAAQPAPLERAPAPAVTVQPLPTVQPAPPAPPLPTVQPEPPLATSEAVTALPGLEVAMARAEAAAARVLSSDAVQQPVVAASSLRVFLHFSAGDPRSRDRAERLAQELRRRGVTVTDIRPVRQDVRSSMVRFYHESDRQQSRELAAALADAAGSAGTPAYWFLSDYTRYSSPPRVGNVEVWIPNG